MQKKGYGWRYIGRMWTDIVGRISIIGILSHHTTQQNTNDNWSFGLGKGGITMESVRDSKGYMEVIME